MKKIIMDIKEFLENIEEYKKDFSIDVMTTPTMYKMIKEIEFFLNILSECSIFAEEYLQLFKSKDWINEFSIRYQKLQKTNIWKIGKYILKILINDTLTSHYIGDCDLLRKGPYGDSCFFCDDYLDIEKATLHHTKYIKFNLFNPKYVTFCHYDCHKEFHKK